MTDKPESRRGVVTCTQRFDSDWSPREVRVVNFRSGKWALDLHTEALNAWIWLSRADVEALHACTGEMLEHVWPEGAAA